MEHVEVEVGKILQPGENLTITEREALEDAAAEFAIALRNMLTGLSQYCLMASTMLDGLAKQVSSGLMMLWKAGCFMASAISFA